MNAKRMGRPSGYRPEFGRQAFHFCLLGATEEQIADLFEVTLNTVRAWKSKHPEFMAALKEGRDAADSRVAKSLYRRAIGYKRKSEKVFCQRDGTVVRAPIVEHVNPDVTACIFWLKNRQPKKWRMRDEDASTGDVSIYIDSDTAQLAGIDAETIQRVGIKLN